MKKIVLHLILYQMKTVFENVSKIFAIEVITVRFGE
jgi:hypothetical protein